MFELQFYQDLLSAFKTNVSFLDLLRCFRIWFLYNFSSYAKFFLRSLKRFLHGVSLILKVVQNEHNIL